MHAYQLVSNDKHGIDNNNNDNKDNDNDNNNNNNINYNNDKLIFKLQIIHICVVMIC